MPEPPPVRKQLTSVDKSALLALRAAGKTDREVGNVMEIDWRTTARCVKIFIVSKCYACMKGSGEARQTSTRGI